MVKLKHQLDQVYDAPMLSRNHNMVKCSKIYNLISTYARAKCLSVRDLEAFESRMDKVTFSSPLDLASFTLGKY